MIDCFETLYAEGADRPKLMSLALHDRLIGRPGRITGLVSFLDHIAGRDRVWICTGRDNRRALAAGCIRGKAERFNAEGAEDTRRVAEEVFARVAHNNLA